MSEKTCCSQRAGMTVTRQMVLPCWLGRKVGPGCSGGARERVGKAPELMLSSHLVRDRLLEEQSKSRDCQSLEQPE